MNTSLRPLSPDDWSPDHARHLLHRAGFGGSPSDTAHLADLSPSDAVDALLDFSPADDAGLPPAPADPDVIRPRTPDEQREYQAARRANDTDTLDRFNRDRQRRRAQDRRMAGDCAQWWLNRLATTPCPLQEKLTLLWHDHFAARHRNVRDAYLLTQQNSLFRTHAAGSFRDLAKGIVRDPAMLLFLNNDRNIARRPNENLARELMELFTLGTNEYTEDDIKQGARALTGYHVRDNDFLFREAVHDDGQKTILNRTAPYDGDAFVDLLLEQPACARFVAAKLYDAFVADLGDRSAGWPGDIPTDTQRVITQLAAILRSNDYDLHHTLRRLFTAEHFYDPAVRGNKIKSPVHLVTGLIRQTGCPPHDTAAVNTGLRLCGQQLFDPPSVAGWDGGRGWINTSTLLARQNLCTYLLTGKQPTRDWSRDDAGNYLQPLADALRLTPDTAPADAIDTLCAHLLPTPPAPARRATLIDFVTQRDMPLNEDVLLALLLLITACPEYQLC